MSEVEKDVQLIALGMRAINVLLELYGEQLNTIEARLDALEATKGGK